jgi:L,D-transpeptidase ErfK/SrfK
MRARGAVAAALLAAWLVPLAGCGPHVPRLRREAALEKITTVEARVPVGSELPGLVGRIQHHHATHGDTLLDVARDSGLGFSEIHEANPSVDEWVPPPTAELVIPSRWIIPRSRYRGLVINIPEMRLYMFPAVTRPGAWVPVLTWPIGIGTDDAPSPVGPFTVRSKDANPTWIVPDDIRKTMDEPKRVVGPGPDNPLGAYRIRLSKGIYAIHGTNSPWSIGRQTTHGCVRLYPEDIAELYPMVKAGFPGELVYQPVKVGEENGRIYVQVHDDVYGRVANMETYAWREVQKAGVAMRVDRERVRAAVREKRGIPIDVTRTGGSAPILAGETHERRDARRRR